MQIEITEEQYYKSIDWHDFLDWSGIHFWLSRNKDGEIIIEVSIGDDYEPFKTIKLIELINIQLFPIIIDTSCERKREWVAIVKSLKQEIEKLQKNKES